LLKKILTSKSYRSRTNVSDRQTYSISYMDLIMAMIVLIGEIEMLNLTSNMVSRPGVKVPVVLSGQHRRGVVGLWMLL